MEMNFTQLTLGQGGWDTQKVDKFAEAVKKDHNKENDKLGDILSGFGQWGKENKQGNMGDYIQSLDKDTKADYQSFLGLDASNKPKEGTKGLGVHVGEGNSGTKYITMTQGKVEKGGMQTYEDTETSRLQEDVQFSNVVDERHIAGKTSTDLERNNDMHIITDANTNPKMLGEKASPDAGSFERPVWKKDTTSEAGTATKPAKLGQDTIGAPKPGEIPGVTKNPDGSLKEFVDPKAAAELEQQNKDLDAATRPNKAEPKAAVKPGTTTPAFGTVTAKTTAPASTQEKTATKATPAANQGDKREDWEKQAVADVDKKEAEAKANGTQVTISKRSNPDFLSSSDERGVKEHKTQEEQIERMAKELKDGKDPKDSTYKLPEGVKLTPEEIKKAKNSEELASTIEDKMKKYDRAERGKAIKEAAARAAEAKKTQPEAAAKKVEAQVTAAATTAKPQDAVKTVADVAGKTEASTTDKTANTTGSAKTTATTTGKPETTTGKPATVAGNKPASTEAPAAEAKAEAATTKPEGKKGKSFEDMDMNDMFKMMIISNMMGGGNNGGGMGSNPMGMLLAAQMLGIDPKELGLAGGSKQAPGMGNDERYGTNAPSAFQRGSIISALNLDGYKDSKEYKQTQYDNARNDADRYTNEAKNGKAGWFTKTFFGRTDEDVQEAAAKKRDAALEKAASIDSGLHPQTADANA